MVPYQELLIRLLTGFLILIMGLIIAQVTSNILRRFIKGIEVNKTLEQQLKIKINLENYISAIVKYIIYLITIIFALNQLGVSTKILQTILVVFIILIVIFIILAFKDWLPNLISGIYIIRTEKIKLGDKIKTKDIKGKVIEIKLLETKIETNNNEIIFIPNSNLTKLELVKEKK
ncbi:mechanosensitive ion channel [Candidatus Woesearchaeota archaeon]|nr:mechanosensitive ion channel [Candidatus Woesearchaeota archaeon]